MGDDLATKDLKKRIGKFGAFGIIGIFAVAAVILLGLLFARVSFFAISGVSMEPTLKSGTSVVVKQSKAVIKDELLFFNKPSSWADYKLTDTILVKRIVATPHDLLEFDGERFLVNGESVYELAADDYECAAGAVGFSHRLDQTQIFVMGDNPLHSLDSRRIFCDGDVDSIFIPRQSVVDYGQVVLEF